MKSVDIAFRKCPCNPGRWIVRLAAIALAVAFTLPVSAAPITYTGFTITSGKLGPWEFKNARVYLRFKSDTNNVQFTQFPIDPNDPNAGTVDTYFNSTGTATVTIVTPEKQVSAVFAPNQIFVALDLGDTSDVPHVGGRGVGFGSFTATGVAPAYPLGVEDGTIDFGDALSPSPELVALSTDLMHDTAFSGRAWVCVNFPTGGAPCDAPPPLKTNKGDLLLFQPYQVVFPADPTAGTPAFFGDTLSGGVFFAVVGEEEDLDSED